MLIALITFFAAVVNGALGYGFSSITVPLALLFLTNRVLNPAIVLVEVFLNLYVLYVNRRSLPRVLPRLKTILFGIFPAILLGGYFLHQVNPSWVKLWTYALLLPLLFIQVTGVRRPIRMEKAPGAVFGVGLGFLYSLTTISGPPLALLFNNEGLQKEDFRAALGVVRVFESIVTCLTYVALGLVSRESVSLTASIVPAVLVGIPLGGFLIKKMNADVFRRICMSFDVMIVAFGLSKVLQSLELISVHNYLILIAAIFFDGLLLCRFFLRRKRSENLASPALAN